MSAASAIEWTDATWNPVRGCTRVSPGCGGPGAAGGCYAEVMAARFSGPGQWGHGFAERVRRPGGKTGYRWTGHVALIEDQLTLPMTWRRPRRIFVNSTSDLFHEKLPDEAIDRVFAVMALCPQHTFQVLTKRPERMRDYMDRACGRIADTIIRLRRERGDNGIVVPLPHIRPGAPWWPLPNVWLGVSAERQQEADERIPALLGTPAAVRFLSAEPLLGPIDLTNLECPGFGREDALVGSIGIPRRRPDGLCDGFDWRDSKRHLDWVIVGGESGRTARPMHPDWARQIRDACAAAGVPLFFKQWGEWAPEHQPGRGYSESQTAMVDTPRPDWDGCMWRVGKKAAGRRLDGVEHNGFPAAPARDSL